MMFAALKRCGAIILFMAEMCSVLLFVKAASPIVWAQLFFGLFFFELGLPSAVQNMVVVSLCFISSASLVFVSF